MGSEVAEALLRSIGERNMTTGTLYTLGYAEPNATERLEALMAQPRTAIVDIRYAPYSRWSASWNSRTLMHKYGPIRYHHAGELGNVNYNKPGLPIQLADPDVWVQKCVKSLQQGWSLVLLCACKDYERCHRKTVYDLIQAALPVPRPVNICTPRPQDALPIFCEIMDCDELATYNCYPQITAGSWSLQQTIAVCDQHAREADPTLDKGDASRIP